MISEQDGGITVGCYSFRCVFALMQVSLQGSHSAIWTDYIELSLPSNSAVWY